GLPFLVRQHECVVVASTSESNSGAAVARETSFLKTKMDQQIFPSNINIIDDPFIKRGLGSRLYDGDGLPCHKTMFVENGILQHWLLDLRSSRQLGFSPTGHSGGVSNFYIDKGDVSLDDLLSDIKYGFYCTDLMGMGVNMVTGDYSMGASGFLIEKGKITTSVSEITIASNLNKMFENLVICDDLEFRYRVNVPHLMIPKMSIAGN
ncbi:MAG: metallopeptidase TldD-related protein, partial [Pseudomonadota bacterium]